jgi:hypothetical protein
MNPKLKELLPQIEERLMRDDIANFTIGITGQLSEDMTVYLAQGYSLWGFIADGNDEMKLDNAKTDLSKCVSEMPTIESKYERDADITAGKQIEIISNLYIVAKPTNPKKGLTINDIWDVYLPYGNLFGFEPIVL